MGDWKKWVIIAGGVVAVIGQFWGFEYYLPLIGGAAAAIIRFIE